jgi:ferric-dicitrate binding protein FerR (iron transport regulator)
VSTDPRIKALLAPLAERDVAPSRRWKVDRDKIISGMMRASLTPDRRFSSRGRWAAALSVAASLALVSWWVLRWNEGRVGEQLTLQGIEVVAVRGKVAALSADGMLETSAGAMARIKSRGVEVELLESTKVSLSRLGASADSAAIRLVQGSVRCVIPHQPGRTFTVVTADARVIDVGTVFSVAVKSTAAGPKTIVDVEEGEVLVEYAGGQRRLTASQSWSSRPFTADESSAPAAADSGRAQLLPAAPSAVRRGALPVPSAKRPRETLATETQLLRSGLAKEQKGDARGAAADFEALVSSYPDSLLAPDAKAALARVRGRLGSPQ